MDLPSKTCFSMPGTTTRSWMRFQSTKRYTSSPDSTWQTSSTLSEVTTSVSGLIKESKRGTTSWRLKVAWWSTWIQRLPRFSLKAPLWALQKETPAISWRPMPDEDVPRQKLKRNVFESRRRRMQFLRSLRRSRRCRQRCTTLKWRHSGLSNGSLESAPSLTLVSSSSGKMARWILSTIP